MHRCPPALAAQGFAGVSVSGSCGIILMELMEVSSCMECAHAWPMQAHVLMGSSL